MRPSIFPPRGFFISASPQFVVLTHDGPLTNTTYELMNSLTYNKSANGCPVRGTMFTPMRGTGARGGRRGLPAGLCNPQGPGCSCELFLWQGSLGMGAARRGGSAGAGTERPRLRPALFCPPLCPPTDCKLASNMYKAGFEIADFTKDEPPNVSPPSPAAPRPLASPPRSPHAPLPSPAWQVESVVSPPPARAPPPPPLLQLLQMGQQELRFQVDGSRVALASCAAIPESSIVGFRRVPPAGPRCCCWCRLLIGASGCCGCKQPAAAGGPSGGPGGQPWVPTRPPRRAARRRSPRLETNPTLRRVLYNNRFLYDRWGAAGGAGERRRRRLQELQLAGVDGRRRGNCGGAWGVEDAGQQRRRRRAPAHPACAPTAPPSAPAARWWRMGMASPSPAT